LHKLQLLDRASRFLYLLFHRPHFPKNKMPDLKGFMDTGSSMGAIIAAITLPNEYPPVRIRDAYSSVPVAVAKATEDVKISWASAIADTLIPATDMVIFLFRNALRNRIQYNHNPTGTGYNYQWRYDGSSATPGLFPVLGPLGVFELEPSYADASTPFAPHGPRLPSGVDKGHQYIWIDAIATAGAIAQVVLGVIPVGGDLGNVQLMRWNDGKRSVAQTTPLIVNTTYNFTITQSGYYSITINHVAGPTNFTSAAVQVGMSAPCWEHHMLTGYNLNLAKVQSYAITAGALLWRNTASFENAQGDMGCVQVGNGVGWETVAAAGSYSGIASQYPQNWNSRFFAKGEYAYLKPEDAEDLQMVSDVDLSPGGFATMSFPLDERAPFLVFAASCSVTAGRETSLRSAVHIQYQTNDTWADVRQSDNTRKDWEDAFTTVSSMEQIYDNPTHIGEILATIGRYGAIAADLGSKVLSIFGYEKAANISKQLSPVLEGMERFGGSAKRGKYGV
jgi:hypothetical protein